MAETGHGHKVDYWGRKREIVSLKDHVLVRPIAKEVDWPISEAIDFRGVDRRFLLHEMPNGRTRFTLPKEQEAAFRAEGAARGRHKTQEHERRLREDAAYQVRVQREAKASDIYAEHRRETAEAVREYQDETTAADREYGEARIKAGEAADARKKAAAAAYQVAVSEADEDRDEALASLGG